MEKSPFFCWRCTARLLCTNRWNTYIYSTIQYCTVLYILLSLFSSPDHIPTDTTVQRTTYATTTVLSILLRSNETYRPCIGCPSVSALCGVCTEKRGALTKVLAPGRDGVCAFSFRSVSTQWRTRSTTIVTSLAARKAVWPGRKALG